MTPEELALPWRVSEGTTYRHRHLQVCTQPGAQICVLWNSNQMASSRARFIVRACNNHHALLAAAKLAMEDCCDLISTDAGNALAAAIAAAETEP